MEPRIDDYFVAPRCCLGLFVKLCRLSIGLADLDLVIPQIMQEIAVYTVVLEDQT